MRSKEKDLNAAKRKLTADIKNSARHVLGLHDQCSTDFCKASTRTMKNISNGTVIDEESLNDEDDNGDAVKDACDMWVDTMMEMSVEDEMKIRKSGTSKESINPDLLKDIFFILNKMSMKSDRLICNFTSNLAESWMNIRCKFDGGKMKNRCFRGSFFARCYGGGLRSSRGPAWSPMVFSKVTGLRADNIYIETYRLRAKHYARTVKRQRKTEVKLNRYKRKMTFSKENKNKKAKLSYGPEVLIDSPDLPPEELQPFYNEFYNNDVKVSNFETQAIELETRGQSNNDKWKSERRKRITSSVFGEVICRGLNNNSPMLTKKLLYSNFNGNIYTRRGLMEEENARKEYVNKRNKEKPEVSHITVPGLVICQEFPFLAASSDGIVEETGGGTGLIEIKNLLQTKDMLIMDATKKDKHFCLGTTHGTVSLKKNHKYYYQVQGQLNILNKDWCDFLIRRTNPYDMYVERINRDIDLWKYRMLPKLKAFYFTHLLPELAVPRYRSVSGIRKPSLPWYSSSDVAYKSSSLCKPPFTTKETPRKVPSPLSEADIPIQHKISANKQSSTQRSSRSRRTVCIKFVGRRILHNWEDKSGKEQWFSGVVLGVSKGKDGSESAIYQVQYRDDNDIYDVDDLHKDYQEGNLRFDDL